MNSIQSQNFKAWITAIRPKTLPIGLAPVIAGGASAFNIQNENINIAALIICAVTSLLLQITSNFANDLFDHQKGADKDRSGPLRVTSSGLISEQNMRMGIILSASLSALSGLYLVYLGGALIAGVGIAAILSAVVYTGGPWPLGYNGLGDLFIFLFFGLAGVAGTAFLVAGYVPESSWYGAVSIGVLASNVLVVNNIRDIKGDKASKKKTLIVKFGKKAGYTQYGLCVAIAFVSIILLYLKIQNSWILLPLLLLPIILPAFIKLILTKSPKTYNSLLGFSSLFVFFFSLLFGTGLILSISS